MCYGAKFEKLYSERSEEQKKQQTPKEGQLNIPEPKEVELEVPVIEHS